MCGFVGIVSSKRLNDHDWLKNSAGLLSHRGPDSSGGWTSTCGKVSFYHNRLKIVDLSENAKQPMLSEDESCVLAFNGEIYNFTSLRKELMNLGTRFKTQSDTEVILRAYQKWGSSCIARLKGMFSLAIFDQNKNIIIIARDRTGEKPMFYFHHKNVLYFASELRALIANKELPKKISKECLNFFLTMGFIPKEKCILEGYNKVKPAEILMFNLLNGDLKKWEYWTIPNFKSQKSDMQFYDEKNIFKLEKELENLLSYSIQKQLIADVPVGILLSGGVDSSLVTGIASSFKENITTFNVSFPENVVYNESEHAKNIANHFKTNHIEIEVRSKLIDDFENLTSIMDEPVIDSSIIPTFLLCREVSKHVKVALGGDGADELFGGYDHYKRLAWMKSNLNLLPFNFRKLISLTAKNFLPHGFKGKNYFENASVDFNKDVPLVAKYFSENEKQNLFPDFLLKDLDVLDFWHSQHDSDNKDLLDNAMRLDFALYLPDDILVKIDRASMASSLELRSPFLDVDLIEFAFSKVPSFLKVRENHSKILLKRLVKKLLPQNFNLHRKQGFNLPLNVWLKQKSTLSYFKETLCGHNSIFNQQSVKKLFQGQKLGINNSERLFGLLALQLWCNKHKVTIE